mgnify:CR=1 FL=1
MPSSDPDSLIGIVLEGQFRIERLIGHGGMGRVYVAESQRLKRRCALKVLIPELTADDRCVQRFLREAQAIAQIRHENVVDIHHLGEDPSGIVFFAMELLSGEDLASRFRRREQHPFNWRTALDWMLQITRALIAVHAAGLIHRDLKPSNVYITRDLDGREKIKLLDFGIVKGEDHPTLTGTGTVIGTPSFMSPEQIQGNSVDRRSDIYSLGVLCYEALAGRRPFVGEPLQVAYHHCHTPPPPLRSQATGIPVKLEQLVMSMLAKDVAERVQTAEAVEQILLEVLAGRTQAMVAPAIRERSPATYDLAPVRGAAAPVQAGPAASPVQLSAVASSRERAPAAARSSPANEPVPGRSSKVSVVPPVAAAPAAAARSSPANEPAPGRSSKVSAAAPPAAAAPAAAARSSSASEPSPGRSSKGSAATPSTTAAPAAAARSSSVKDLAAATPSVKQTSVAPSSSSGSSQRSGASRRASVSRWTIPLLLGVIAVGCYIVYQIVDLWPAPVHSPALEPVPGIGMPPADPGDGGPRAEQPAAPAPSDSTDPPSVGSADKGPQGMARTQAKRGG